MNPSTKVDVEEVISGYPIDVDSTTLISVRDLHESTNIFRVDRSDLSDELYIIDSVPGKNVACHPHIVGEMLKHQTLNAAYEAAKAMRQLTDVFKPNREVIVVEHVLRGAPGYELHTALRELPAGSGFRDVWIRLRYEKPSYRSHSEDETSMRLNIIYEDFDALPWQRDVVVLKPDTEATGKTGQKAIDRIVKKCAERDSLIKTIVLYGFISIPALTRIRETTKKHGIKLVAFSMGNLTELAYNGYDMTLYGIDESMLRVTGEVRKLGSIVDPQTLARFLPEFVPGSDQPGDWSSRQTSVYVTKEEQEPGGITGHLRNSIQLIERLRNIPDYAPWQQRIAEKELELLHSTLRGLKKGPRGPNGN